MYLLLVLSVLLLTANTALTKVFQQSIRADLAHLSMYNLINALFACVFFLISAGFRIQFNRLTALYALVYAVIICVNLSAQILALELVTVPMTTLMSVAGAVLIPAVFGLLFNGEPLSWRLILSVVLILTATALSLSGKLGGVSLRGALTCGVLFVLGGASVVLVQVYSRAEGVCDSQSFFFLTNLVIGLLCLCLALSKWKKLGLRQLLRLFRPRQLGIIASKTALANLCSMLQVPVLRQMAASDYAVWNSSLSLLGSVAVSVLLFREKQTAKSITAVLLAIAALIAAP